MKRTRIRDAGELNFHGLGSAEQLELVLAARREHGHGDLAVTVSTSDDDGETWSDVDEHTVAEREQWTVSLEDGAEWLRVAWTVDDPPQHASHAVWTLNLTATAPGDEPDAATLLATRGLEAFKTA